jgi:FecR protein
MTPARQSSISTLFATLLLSLACAMSGIAHYAFAQTNTPTKSATNEQPAKQAQNNRDTREVKLIEINSAARVVFIEGDVSIIGTNNQKRPAKLGDTVFEGDNLVTGKDGELHMDMEDSGYIAVRPNTKMNIVKYQAKGDDGDTSVIGLSQGSFRSVSGWIGKFNQPKYVVRTPNATINIRGTDHESLVILKGTANAEGAAGTYDKVNLGGSTIKTAKGNVNINPSQAGFVGNDAKAPRVMAEVPKFFRATRNEKLIEGKHAAVQQRITERRDARRQEMKIRAENAAALNQQRRQEAAAAKEKSRAERK